MINPKSYNLPLIYQRSSYDFIVQLLRVTNEPIDLCQYQILCQMWDIKRTLFYGQFRQEILDYEAAVLKFYLTPEETQILPRFGLYDVKLINLDDRTEYYVLKGTFTTAVGYTDN
jgi:hypothetical protein